MSPEEQEAVRERFRVALDLFELAEAMTRARLRRECPGASAEEIEALVGEWRSQRPASEDEDRDLAPMTLGLLR